MSHQSKTTSTSLQRFIDQVATELTPQLLPSPRQSFSTVKSQRRIGALSPFLKSAFASFSKPPALKTYTNRSKPSRKWPYLELAVRKLADIANLRSREVLGQLRRVQIAALRNEIDAKSALTARTFTLKQFETPTKCQNCSEKQLSEKYLTKIKPFLPSDAGKSKKRSRKYTILSGKQEESSDLSEIPTFSDVQIDLFSSSNSSEASRLLKSDQSIHSRPTEDTAKAPQASRLSLSCIYRRRRQGEGMGTAAALKILSRLIFRRKQRAFLLTFLSRRR